ncbi:MAG: TRAP transporter large permease [Dehalococcoidia bacterium]|nr:TRAP transporter large permease [Dehalococcoidia bacterium]
MSVVALIGIAILIALLVIGVPVPFSFAAAMVFMIVGGGYDPSMALHFGYYKMNSLILLAIPLFIMAGGIMGRGGIGERLVGVIEVFIGRVKGGLGAVGVVTCAVFGAISGSAAAALSAIGSIMFPRMNERGYPIGHSAALISCASVLALLIPPSIDMILFGWLAEQSIAACFLATVGPGIFTVITLCLVNWWLLRRASLAVPPQMTVKERTVEIGRRGKNAFFALMMPVIILGGIYGGVFTPTEAAGVSVIYAMPVAVFIYRGLKLRGMGGVLVDTATTSAVIMLMFFFALVLSQLFIRENLPHQIAALMLGISTNKYIILLMVNIFLIFIGMVMDDVSGITLTTPLLMPLMRELGVNPLQFAAIIGTNLGMGCMTPPTAPLLYLGARIANTDMKNMLKPAMIMIIFGMLPGVLAATYWPELALWLPRITGFMR